MPLSTRFVVARNISSRIDADVNRRIVRKPTNSGVLFFANLTDNTLFSSSCRCFLFFPHTYQALLDITCAGKTLNLLDNYYGLLTSLFHFRTLSSVASAAAMTNQRAN
jgi:hypothetical protein